MDKGQLSIGLIVSIICLVALIFLAFLLEKSTGQLAPSSFALVGWVSGICGMFAASTN